MIRPLALLLTVLTGFSGLVYEVTWEKYLATLLGSHSEATATVLGLFLGGLAAGYSLFGRFTRRRVAAAQAADRSPKLLHTYGVLEIGIGLYAIAFPFLFDAVRAVSLWLPYGAGGLGFAIDVVLSALLIVPPAVLMGGTIPMLTQALARSLDDATRFHALVYAFNTAGAFAGALAAGFWLIPALGLAGSLRAVAVLNLVAGAVFLRLDRSHRMSLGTDSGGSDSRSPIPGFTVMAAAALLCGFAMMTLQTVLIRLGGLSFGSSPFTFSMIVAVFVLCIALGSGIVSALPRVPRGLLIADLWGIPLIFWLLYGELENSPYWAHVLRSVIANLPEAFYFYYAAAFLGVLVFIGPAVVLSGATLPLIFDHLRRETVDLGDTAGRLYSWNTVGSLLGALLGGYALFFWLDLHHVFRVALGALVLAATLVTVRVASIPWYVGGILLATCLGAILLLPGWAPERLSSGLFRERVSLTKTFDGPDALFATIPGIPVFYDDDPNSSVAVTRIQGRPDYLNILVNGKSDGAVPNDMLTMSLAVLLPAILAEKAETAFVIGLGTGVSAGVFAALDSAVEVQVAEISSAVLEAAPLFDFANQATSQNPKLKTIHGDAYRSLVRSDQQFDVIVSEPSNPWVTGVEMLYSVEFLESARDQLAPGGIYAQWIHSYESNPETVAMVLRTYSRVFEHVAVWYAMGVDLLILGVTDPALALDLDRIQQRAERPDIAAALRDIGIDNLIEFLAHELIPIEVIANANLTGPVHTLQHPRLSHIAARAFFSGGEGLLPKTAGIDAARVGQRNSLWRRYLAENPGTTDAAWATFVTETCEYRGRECVTLLAAWDRISPGSTARRAVIQRIQRDPVLSKTTKLSVLRSLAVLYGGAPEGGKTPYQIADEASRRFELFYSHAVPFPRQRLARLWSRCEKRAKVKQACVDGRKRTDEALGNLDEPLVLPDARTAPAARRSNSR